MNIFGFNKLFDHPNKLNLFLNKDKTLTTVEIDLTNICNHRCPKCAGLNDDKVSLSYEEVCNIVDQLKEFGVKGIILTGGGEPLLNSDCLNILRYIKSKNIDVALIIVERIEN